MSINLSTMKLISLVMLAAAQPVLAQVNTGELRLRVTDPAGLGIRASITISNEANQYRNTFTTDSSGEADIKTLAYIRFAQKSRALQPSPRMPT